MEGWVPKFKKIGYVTLATPTLGVSSFIVRYVVLAMADITKKNVQK